MKVTLVVLLVLCSSISGNAFEEHFSIRKDMTYDGISETINYIVRGDDWNQPISWSFSIKSNGKEIFRHVVENDTNIVHFDDPGYVNNCDGLVECRQKWFLTDSFKAMFDTVKKTEPRHSEILRIYKMQAPIYYIENLGLNAQDTDKSINKLAEFLKGRDIICFTMPESPVYFGALMTYDPYNKDFVHLYHP